MPLPPTELSLAQLPIVMGALGALGHLAIDSFVACQLACEALWTLAFPMVVLVGLAVYYLFRHGLSPRRIVKEVVHSMRRGVVTDEYLMLVRGDKGVVRLPEIAFRLYALPLSVKGELAALGVAASILTSVASIAKFVFVEFDLGVDCGSRDMEKKAQTTTRCWEARRRSLPASL